RIVEKTMSRRDRKALALQASRFGFESIDPDRWAFSVRRTADRLGLLLAGDVAAAARAATRPDPARWQSTVRRTANPLRTLPGDRAGAPFAAVSEEEAPRALFEPLPEMFPDIWQAGVRALVSVPETVEPPWSDEAYWRDLGGLLMDELELAEEPSRRAELMLSG